MPKGVTDKRLRRNLKAITALVGVQENQSTNRSRTPIPGSSKVVSEQAPETGATGGVSGTVVEKNFQAIEKQQSNALKAARRSVATDAANDASPVAEANDNLQEIIGIGKVFEHTLNELGVTSFRQIANFGISDIARVNAELKEFKGRMEQDDWIGQAKDLHFKKYGNG